MPFNVKEKLLAFEPPDQFNNIDLSVIFEADITGGVGGGGSVLNDTTLHTVDPPEFIA